MDFHYDYAADESNIWKMWFDHRSSSPYNEYTYDNIDRLTGVTYLDSDMESFVMDDLGNRAGNQTLRDDGTVNFAVDTLTNRYTSVGGNSLAYDNSGNLTQDKDGYQFTYDYENRIIEIRSSSDAPVAAMDYDTQGRRIRVYDAIAGTTKLYYYSDNWQVLAEYNDSGVQQAYYVFGNYIDEVLLMHRNSADNFYLHDHLYSPVALLNASGNIIERYEYDAYGKVTILSSNFSPLSSSQYANAYYFTGREVDFFDNGSLPLQYNHHSYLSQHMGRWLSPESSGTNIEAQGQVRIPRQYRNGLNLYLYLRDDFVAHRDSDDIQHMRYLDEYVLLEYGTTKCDPETGAVDPKINNNTITRPCTVAHENRHVSQLSSCCAKYAKAWKEADGGWARYKLKLKWGRWFQHNTDDWECIAHKTGYRCAADLKRKYCGKCSQKDWADILSYEKTSLGLMLDHCDGKTTIKPCPFD